MEFIGHRDKIAELITFLRICSNASLNHDCRFDNYQDQLKCNARLMLQASFALEEFNVFTEGIRKLICQKNTGQQND